MSHNLYKQFQLAQSNQEKQSLVDKQSLEQLKSFALFVQQNIHGIHEKAEIFPYIVRSFISHNLDGFDYLRFNDLIGENEYAIDKLQKPIEELLNEIKSESKAKNISAADAFENIYNIPRISKIIEHIANIFIHAEKQKVEKDKVFPTHIHRNSR